MKRKVNLKIILGVLAVIALILGVIAYFIIFGTGTNVIQPNTATTTPAKNSSSAIFEFPPSSATSSLGSETGSASGTSSGPFLSNFSAPYPVSWSEGESQFAISGASLSGNELTLLVNVTMGDLPQCVPINIRLISDEEGDMIAPASPSATNFSLSTSTCVGTPNTIYPNQPLTFTVNPMNMPFLLMTGGTSNIYFEVATTTDGGLDVAPPQQSG